MTTKEKQPKTEFLTLVELADRIDETAQNLFQISGIEFIEQLEQGKLEDTFSVHYLRMLYNLAEDAQRPTVLSSLRRCAERSAQRNGHKKPVVSDGSAR